MSDSSSSSSWLDDLINLYTHYQAGQTANDQMKKAQQSNLDLWRQGYSQSTAPYMAETLNPLLNAVMGQQMGIYNNEQSKLGLGLVDWSQFLHGVPGITPTGAGSNTAVPGSSGGATSQAPFAQGSSGTSASGGAAAEPGSSPRDGVSDALHEPGGVGYTGGAGSFGGSSYDLSGAGAGGFGGGTMHDISSWLQAHPNYAKVGAGGLGFLLGGPAGASMGMKAEPWLAKLLGWATGGTHPTTTAQKPNAIGSIDFEGGNNGQMYSGTRQDQGTAWAGSDIANHSAQSAMGDWLTGNNAFWQLTNPGSGAGQTSPDAMFGGTQRNPDGSTGLSFGGPEGARAAMYQGSSSPWDWGGNMAI